MTKGCREGTALHTSGGRALGCYASVHLHQPSSVTEQGRTVGRRVQVVENKLAQPWRTAELKLHGDRGPIAEYGT
jgi:RecA/RadA recombinase